MRAADTNVLVRLLVRDDARQLAAVTELLESGPVWISHVVLVEALWVLEAVYGVKRPELAAAVDQLLDHASLGLQDPDVIAEALASFRAHPWVGFSDCIVLAIAQKAGHLPLATFDRSLARIRGATRVPS